MEQIEQIGGGEQVVSGTAAGKSVQQRVRAVLANHGQLGVDIAGLQDTSDLYEAGMTSRASVSVMLGLEGEFGIEFPDTMLRRDVFVNIGAISAAIEQLIAKT